MGLLHALWFLVPALALADWHRGEDGSRWHLAAGAGLAVVAVGWLGYAFALATAGTYSLPILLAVNAAFLPALVLRRRRILAWLVSLPGRPRPSREDLATIAVIAVGAIVGLVLFQSETFGNTCLHRSLSTAIDLPYGADPAGLAPSADPYALDPDLLSLAEDEREGTYALIAPFSLLWGFFGLRLFYAVAMAASGVFGALAARHCIPGSAPARLLVTALFVGFPLGTDILCNDGNTVSFFVAAALACALLGSPSRAGLGGALFAVLVACRHAFVVGGLGPLVLAMGGEDRWRSGLRFALVAGLCALPVVVHHAVAFGHPLAFESFQEHGSHLHQLFGQRFRMAGMLNFPLYPQLVRTPFNALPHMLLLPVWLAARMGLVLSALMLLGAGVGLWRAHWRGLAWVAWALPYLLILTLNENWIQVEKLGMIAPVMPMLLLAVGLGLAWLLTRARWPLRLVALAGCGALILGAHHVALSLEVRPDPRFGFDYDWVPGEQPVYLELERDLLRLGMLPRPEWARMPASLGTPRAALSELLEPRYQERAQTPREEILERVLQDSYRLILQQRGIRSDVEPIPDGPTRSFDIDLSRPWVAEPGWLTERAADAAEAGLLLDLQQAPSEGLSHRRFPHPWAEELPASIDVFYLRGTVWVVLYGTNPYQQIRWGEFGPEGEEAWELAPDFEITAEAPPDARFSLVAPRDAELVVVELLSLEPGRMYVWRLAGGAPVQSLRGPIHLRSN